MLFGYALDVDFFPATMAIIIGPILALIIGGQKTILQMGLENIKCGWPIKVLRRLFKI